MSSLEPNPYAAPSPTEAKTSVSWRLAIFGKATAGIFGVVYLLVVAASAYEIVPATTYIGSYLREGILAAISALICHVTIRQFQAKNEQAVFWLMGCPVLFVIWIYPGTSAATTFVLRLFGQ